MSEHDLPTTSHPPQEHLPELLAAARRRPAERDELHGEGRHAHHLGAAAARAQGTAVGGEARAGQAPMRSLPVGLGGHFRPRDLNNLRQGGHYTVSLATLCLILAKFEAAAAAYHDGAIFILQ